jgi:hypothetical protein
MSFKSLQLTSVISIALALSACGGGGSGSTNTQPTADPTNQISDDTVSSGNNGNDTSDDIAQDNNDQPAQTLSITGQPSSQTLASGGDYTLSLSVDSSSAYTVTWLKNGVSIGQANSLLLNSLTTSDTASYSCKVTSGDLTRSCSAFSLTVLNAPSVVQSPSNSVTTEGDSTTLSVVAEGSDLSYQWFRDGAAVSGATSSALSLSGVSLSDAGSYYCVISNAVGSQTSGSASLSVLEAVTSSNVAISWVAPSRRLDGSDLNPGEINQYRVYYGPASSTGYSQSVEVNSTDSSVVIEGLDEGDYKFAVSAIDSEGVESSLSDDYLLAVR